MNFDGKVALVTGGADGIGKALSDVFLSKNMKGVCLVDVNEDKGQETAKAFEEKYGAGKAKFCKCDVTSSEQLEAAFKTCVDTFGRLDVACNNAGILNEYKWKLMVSINLNAVIEGTYLAVKYMGTKNGGNGGVVVNTSSVVGLVPRQYAAVYTASKHGVVGFTRSAAFEPDVVDNGIRVVAICPMAVETEFMAIAYEQGSKYTEVYRNEMEGRVPRVKFEELTSAVVQLIEDKDANGSINVIVPGKGSKSIPPPNLNL
ncbi:15-hydroxyprostaglandin dehydrogenase [NAD(+)]-like [Saccoglossus kowalevskii]|uniref:15-hydroxyprostaglandin dehydrogenase [NAD(+)] n=1 Tax=Saccoglossus kowalevskii TaxID=10224 RepID=A0ABM0MA76_SACKO|nr:PREDICTED: 15-hydroxyprostaglandin dehydrogenase [NAD(+)]-like [Saccoglossus kowalevskii]